MGDSGVSLLEVEGEPGTEGFGAGQVWSGGG
jgi:hypothetical protein